jgi:hypothetical protein
VSDQVRLWAGICALFVPAFRGRRLGRHGLEGCEHGDRLDLDEQVIAG